MRKHWGFGLGLLAAGALLWLVPRLSAVEIVPASMQDIFNAMGPDAKGLDLTEDALPDLFALTASRIEENAKQFIVEQPYTSGYWKGGKAVIEYARDLSYTLVSVYDKDGHRQRIYSVRTKFTEHVVRQSRRRSRGSGVPDLEVVSTDQETSSEPAASPSGARANHPKSGYEWDQEKSAYVAVGTPETQASAPSAQAKHVPEATVARVPAKASASSDEDEDDGVWVPAKSKGSTGAKVKVGNTTWVEHKPDVPAHRKHHHKHPTSESKPSVPASAAASKSQETPTDVDSAIPMMASNHPQPQSDQWVPKMGEEKKAAPASDQSVPSTEELLDADHVASPASPSAAKPAAGAVESEETSAPRASGSDAWVPKKTPKSSAPPPPSPEQRVAKRNAPRAEEPDSSAAAGPDTTASDTWVPKKTPTPVAPPEEPELTDEPIKVAMVPKAAPPDNSVEALLKISSQQKSPMPHESDSWVPQKNVQAKPDVDLDKEVARLRAAEKKQAAPKPAIVPVHRDINNPEEGVLPVSSFEKFSGPMYGRHREYERRFFAGKQKHDKVPDHDFYVDEVDRKKEIHNVYYYVHQVGKAPKLVAVERHDRVSFLGNYDIEKEDKGKISTYN